MNDPGFGLQEPLALDALPPEAVVSTPSSGLIALAHISQFLGARRVVRAASAADAVVGWGLRPSGMAARRAALSRGVPFATLEDGFIRSVGLGKNGAAPVSLVLDDRGIYFDSRQPSRLEAILSSLDLGSPAMRRYAHEALERWRSERLSKYNLGEDRRVEAASDRLVLVDQVAGDLSIAGAGASAATFVDMMEAALASREASSIVVRSHPDVTAGKARGFLTEIARRHGVAIVDADVTPHAVLDAAREVWTVSSALGFEALLRGKPVTTFGVPFYAGWGCTDDRAKGPVAEAAFARRGRTVDAETMFAGAFLSYARYADPVTRRAVDFHGAVDRLLDWRARHRAYDRTPVYCYGFSRWKRAAARNFLVGQEGKVIFRRWAYPWALPAKVEPGAARAAVWGSKDRAGFAEACAERNIPLSRVEDGFLRSVGLGSNLLIPGSLIVDTRGIYYDASRPSDLEVLLAETEFNAGLLARARALRQRIVAMALTKYNLPDKLLKLRDHAAGRPIALVVEQVPADTAIRLAGGNFPGNLAFLQAVRDERKDHFIAYKEHPDLVAGNRKGRLPERDILRFADMVVPEGNIATLYADVDELHVQSSTSGFEALMRGTKVVVWGRPFYAGWGLTDDRLKQLRRNRTLSLDALVAATLILYPRYIDVLSGIPCSVEDYLESLADLVRRPDAAPGHRSWFKTIKDTGKWVVSRR